MYSTDMTELFLLGIVPLLVLAYALWGDEDKWKF